MKTKSLLFICTILFFIGFLTTTQAQEFWGTTINGGTGNNGVIFELGVANPGFFNTNYDFGALSGPPSSLMLATNGKMYGITTGQGTLNGSEGTLYEYDPITFTYTKKIDSADLSTTFGGPGIVGKLLEATNGIIYGTTPFGGTFNEGIFFEFNPTTGLFSLITEFDDFSPAIGYNPRGQLIQASNGKLYGVTSNGGANNRGAIFEYDISTNIFRNLYNFGSSIAVEGSLLQASNGKLYGMTDDGGSFFAGIFYEYNITNETFTQLFEFGNGKGANPKGTLVQVSNGKLYGLTELGGANNLGVLFEYDITTNTYTKKIDFDGANHGSRPQGSLLEASNGKFYGTTRFGGLNNLGTLFEYDLATNVLTKKQDMGSGGTGTTVTGNFPTKYLVERSTSALGLSKLEKQFGFKLYPNPSNGVVKLQYKSNLNISKIRLFNSIGSLVKEFKASQTELDILKLPIGLYILKVDTDKGVINKKILKE